MHHRCERGRRRCNPPVNVLDLTAALTALIETDPTKNEQSPDQGRDVADASLREMANAIRALSMDAVQAANSGHPGMPMGMADVATVLFTEALKFDASAPEWPNRDRFVLSAGHGSMLLYSLLYLTGYPEMTIEEIKNFRQFGSKTAGHPEYGHAPGIETTTGPLGQGLANAVGMALSERLLAARVGPDLIDYHTYVIAGDGCLMEGISQEAISLAGHLKLGKLIVLWDDNSITIDGATSLSVSDSELKRFEASGWNTARVDGHDAAAVSAAIKTAKDDPSRPGSSRARRSDRIWLAEQGRKIFGSRRSARCRRDQSDSRETRLAVSAVRGAGSYFVGVARYRRPGMRSFTPTGKSAHRVQAPRRKL